MNCNTENKHWLYHFNVIQRSEIFFLIVALNKPVLVKPIEINGTETQQFVTLLMQIVYYWMSLTDPLDLLCGATGAH